MNEKPPIINEQLAFFNEDDYKKWQPTEHQIKLLNEASNFIVENPDVDFLPGWVMNNIWDSTL